MERMFKFSLSTIACALTLSASAFAAPTNPVVEAFPDLRGQFECSDLFAAGTSAASQGRISCYKGANALACVVGEQAGDGAAAAQKLATQVVVPSKNARDTVGAMIVYPDRGFISGTTKGASQAQQKVLSGQPYKKANAIVAPVSNNVAGRFAKATMVEPIKSIGTGKYLIQDSNMIAGKNIDGVTSFYAVVTPDGEDAVVHYIRDSADNVTLRCASVPSEILGRFLVAPGVVFLNQ